MGLDHNGTKLLLYAKSLGINFEKTITIGEQSLHLDKATLKNNLSEFGITNVNIEDIFKQKGGYSEPFLKLLGAKEVHSIDASDYESATIIHDMNLPIPNKFIENYDVVIDGGSLEHIFNFPVAIKNCMSMVKEGGYFLGITPTNNFFGHGFYQFSPELYFRVFSSENGFEIEKIIFFVDKKNSNWHEVKDPNDVKTRVTLYNRYPSYLFIMGKRIGKTTILKIAPHQSDYQNIAWKWKGNKNDIEPLQHKKSVIVKFFNLINTLLTPLFVQLSVMFKETGSGNKNFFKRISSN